MARAGVHALIPAAGQGRRLGGSVSKQYLPLAGRPVLAHAIEALRRHPGIGDVTVVLAEDDRGFEKAMDPAFAGVHTVIGGASRAQSVLNGLHAIAGRGAASDWVLVHDAARPCLPAACLDALMDQGLAHPDGAILALPVRDTLKRSGQDGTILDTVGRNHLWAAQTPQLFPLQRLAAALEALIAEGVAPTDEASAMQYAGARPLLVMGSPANIKITWPGDVAIAQAWLGAEHSS
jgi:2-C-methyl-D-erythritol 4-phosphate cytidylyltransferase